MSSIPVLLAGTVGVANQDHQASTWAPNLASADLVAEAVWTPPTVDEAAMQRASDLADACGTDLQVSEVPVTSAAGAIVCLRGEERTAFASFAAGRGMPLLVDKPTLDTTDQLSQFAAAASSLPVIPGHHLVFHPGFIRVLAAVRDAEIGLVRAVHTDMVSGGGGLSEVGELRNLSVHMIELMRLVTGRANVNLQGHAAEDGASWSFLGKTDRAIILSHSISRVSAGDTEVHQLRSRMRITGTHGFLTLDFAKPRIELSTVSGATSLPFAESSVVALLKRFAEIARGSGRASQASDFVVISRALDGIEKSAVTGESASITW